MPYLSGGHNNDVVTTGDFVVTACWDNDCPIDILDASTMSVTESLDMTRGDRSGFWSGAISSDRTRVFMGGWISAFLVASPENLILTHWFDNDSVVRSAEFVDDGPRVLLYGVLPRGVGIEVWDVTDMSNPETIARSDIGSSHEPYSIEVDLARRRAIVVDNGGVFYVIDIDQIEPTSHSWPTF